MANVRAKLTGIGGDVLFPYTPLVNYSQSVNYNPYDLVHTNYTTYAYSGTPSPTLQVTGEFTNTTDEEIKHTAFCIHLLRQWSKMNYGINDGAAGTPPPLLTFNYGGMYPNIPVLLSDFSVVQDNQVDQMESTTVGLGVGDTENAWAMSVVNTITVTLLVHRNPQEQKEQFTKRQFANGDLYRSGWI